jgi:hypothetical protein
VCRSKDPLTVALGDCSPRRRAMPLLAQQTASKKGELASDHLPVNEALSSIGD